MFFCVIAFSYSGEKMPCDKEHTNENIDIIFFYSSAFWQQKMM
jgi:hypothetical protein